ncbi:MAG: MFS transporter [Chloroflexi bacterium]|nr:MFS transporter [Chloroflexota bacterium]
MSAEGRPVAAGIDPAVELLKPFHWRIAMLAALAFGGNGVDLGVVSFALPGLRAEWDLAPSELGLVLPAVGLGQCVGAILGGAFGDRFGRRAGFSLASVIAGAGTGLAAAAPNTTILALALFVGGLGFGGVAPIAGALVSEFSPPSHRGRFMALTQVAWVLGWCFAALGGGWFEQQLGWRGILGLGAFPIAIGLVGWLLVPESPRYLTARGRRGEAVALAGRLAERHGVVVPLGEPTTPDDSERVGLAELWSARFRLRTFTLWGTWIAMMAAFSGPVFWLPVLLRDVGSAEALRISAYVGFSMLPASLAAMGAIDRFGRRPLILLSLGSAALGAFAVALGTNAALLVAGAVAIASGTLAAWPVMLAWVSEQYPTRMRATAAGWASGMARMGTVAAPAILGLLLGPNGEGRAVAMLPFALLLSAAVVGCALFGRETAGQSLEETST